MDIFTDFNKELSNKKFTINSTRITQFDDNLILLPITKGLTWYEANTLAKSKGCGLPT